MTLFELRKSYKLLQSEAASIAGVSLQTYRRYEKDETYGNSLIRDGIVRLLNDKCEITFEKGLLTIEEIQEKLTNLFENDEYKGKILFCYVFGSYAKGYATGKSDVDLCLETTLTGFHYFGIYDSCENALHKKVDILTPNQLAQNKELMFEVLKDGIKIYKYVENQAK